MNFNFKKIVEDLIPIFEIAGKESIDLYNKGLKIEGLKILLFFPVLLF